MHVSVGGTTSVEGLKSPETVLSASSLEMAAALMTGHLDNLQLTVEHMYLRHNIEDLW